MLQPGREVREELEDGPLVLDVTGDTLGNLDSVGLGEVSASGGVVVSRDGGHSSGVGGFGGFGVLHGFL
jgi:hypothetical protein